MSSLRSRVLASVLVLAAAGMIALAAVTYAEQRSFLESRANQQARVAVDGLSQLLDEAGLRPADYPFVGPGHVGPLGGPGGGPGHHGVLSASLRAPSDSAAKPRVACSARGRSDTARANLPSPRRSCPRRSR